MDPEKLFEEISQYVNESRALLQEGAMRELAGLEDRVLMLCEEVVQLSQDDRLRYSERLQQLMADLSALGEEIAVQRDAVAEELHNLPQHKKAHAAYVERGKKEEQ